jgi:hypothetical protein
MIHSTKDRIHVSHCFTLFHIWEDHPNWQIAGVRKKKKLNVWICFFAGPLINAKSTKDQKEPGQSKRRRED